MKFLIVVPALLALAHARVPVGRIVGGENTTIEEVPYQLGLQHSGIQYCGAALLTETHLLTAAFCVHVIPPGDLTVIAGTSNYEEATPLPVKNVTLHPNYNYELKDFDVAIVELSDPIALSSSVQTIAVSDSPPPEGSNILLSGWGDLDESGNYSTTLQSVMVPVVDNATCHAVYDGFQSGITDRMFCAGEEGRDSCRYDTGGPAVLNDQIVGIVSWGYGCALKGYPAVYTNTAHPEIRSFIKTVAGV